MTDLIIKGDVNPISLELIVKKNCKKQGFEDLDHTLPNLHRIWLDCCSITAIDNLEVLGSVTHLYLNNNNITIIENLETLCPSLKMLSLKGNQLTKVGDGLICLDNLMTLDLSSNEILNIESKELPEKISFLDLSNNPLMRTDTFNCDTFLDNLQGLKYFNGERVNCDVDSEDESVSSEVDELEQQVFCLQEKTRELRNISKERQSVYADSHEEKRATLALLKEEMEESRNNPSVSHTDLADFNTNQMKASAALEPGICFKPSALNVESQPLAPIERPISSRSNSLPPLEPSHIRRRLSETAKKPVAMKDTTRVSSPKRGPMRDSAKCVDISLRQPLGMALVKADDFDEYISDVGRKFDALRSGMGKL